MTIQNPARPSGTINGQGVYLPQSFRDLAYQGDLNDTSNLVYVGFAKPGSDTSAPVWQIFFIEYDGSIPTSITWPINDDGIASNDFIFAWDSRTDYTYS